MAVFNGTFGNDFLIGSLDADSILGFSGYDQIFGWEGDDLVFGNEDSDTLHGNQGQDTIYGGKGDDLIQGGRDNDQLFGEIGNDTIFGDRGNDTVFGGDGDDLLFGDRSEFDLTGNGDNLLFGGSGNDTIFGQGGNDRLFGNQDNDIINGNQGEDTLYAGQGEDTLYGGQDNDRLFGDLGNDLLFGDLGADTITGGDGNDIFVIGRRDDVPGFLTTGGLNISDADYFTDFKKGEDLIQLIGNLSFAELNIFAGSDIYADHTIIQDKGTGEYLAILKGVDSNTLTSQDFLFTSSPTPVNKAPTDIGLSNNGVAENSANSAFIGTFSVTDPDAGDTHTYSLLDNAGGRFAIDGDRLIVANGSLLDFEASSNHQISVRVTDAGGLSFEKVLAIALSNVNEVPTISAIPNQTTNENTATNAISFTIGDAETAADSLTITASSSNPSLIPDGNIVFAGSGANRTVTITPANNQFGTAQITLNVSDGTNITKQTFDLTVNSVNAPPTISAISPQTTNENTATNAISFTIGDAETAADSLTITASSSNPSLIPDGNIVFAGSGANRTVTITPANNQFGTAQITLNVSDGTNITKQTFDLTVNSVNDAPTISAISNQTTNENTATNAISFTIGDAETAADSLTLTANSSNPSLIPDGNIVFAGTGANRTVTITPANNQFGTAQITLNVSDGTNITKQTFDLTVNSVNDPPTISEIANQITKGSQSTDAIAFTISDTETPAGSLTLTGSSSNPNLVPDGNIVFGGANGDRTVTITPAKGQFGTTTITVNVSDGTATTSETFDVIVPGADLELTTTGSKTPTPDGNQITYTVTLANNGPDAANNIQVKDIFPAGFTQVSINPSVGSYDSGSGIWSLPNLGSGSNATLTFSGKIGNLPPDAVLTNAAEVIAVDEADPDSTPGNNVLTEDDQDEVQLTVEADLMLKTEVSKNPTPDGNEITYTVTLTNDGADTATNIVIGNQLPPDFNPTGNASVGNYDANSKFWSLPSLAKGNSAVLTLTGLVGQVPPNFPLTLRSQVQEASQFDPDSTPGNGNTTEDDYSEATTTLSADLELDTQVTKTPTPFSNDLTYTVTLTNKGTDTATNVVVKNELLYNFTVKTNTTSVGSFDPGLKLWGLPSLAPGSSATLTFGGTVGAFVPPGQPLRQISEVREVWQQDPDSTPNNGAPAEDDIKETIVNLQADLAVDTIANTTTANVGDTVSFTVTLTNNGTDTATNIAVNNVIPSNLTGVTVNPSTGTYDSGSSAWNVSALAPGNSVTLTLQGTIASAASGTTLSHSVNVTASSQADPQTTNNSDNATINVTALPTDATVTLSVNPAKAVEGGSDTLVYTFTRDTSINAPLSNALTVNFNVGGAAVVSDDYTQTGASSFSATAGQVTFAAGSNTATVTLTPILDAIAIEEDETVDLTVVAGTGYVSGTPGAISSTIVNSGDTFTQNSIAFRAGLEVDTATVAGGAPGDGGFAINGSTFGNNGTNRNNAIRNLLSSAGSDASSSLNADGLTRGGVKLSWNGFYLTDRPGNDFVLAENGNLGRPEYFVVRVKPVGDVLTNFFYKPATEAVQNSSFADFLTAFDLSGDFGLTAGTKVEYIEVWNLMESDRFGSSGTGFVGSGSTPATPGSLDFDGTIESGQNGQYDADLSYVWAVNPSNLTAM
ncbi:beta strand repeat-containing protein [Aerosakkonemataceae cyanobacterium BLCC-F50]|uniref:Beta strand repeat-containing protein n=1 Tax=Floridaenema flaviceps BLCC-F50 TaxID=3153642 RepID=A0ABV4XQZ3_9CYAN